MALRKAHPHLAIKPLAAFLDDRKERNKTSIHGRHTLPCSVEDYANLVDWTGRQPRPGKYGFISPEALPILDRIDLEPDDWLNDAMAFEKTYRRRSRKANPRQ